MSGWVILLLVFLGGESSGLVHDLHSQLIRPLDDLLSLLGANIVRNYGGELLVVHQQHFNISGCLDQERVETILELETSFLSGSITDLRHENGTLELSSNSIIDTTGLSPRRLMR